jgi:hypothetical protein
MLNKMRGRTILSLLFIIQLLFPQQIGNPPVISSTLVALNLKAQQTQTVIAPDDPYWSGQCKVSENNQSPINIVAPFTYMGTSCLQSSNCLDFKVDWNLQQYYGGMLVNDEGFNLKMEGDFGNYVFKGKTYSIYELRFKSPSEHTVIQKFPILFP